MQTKVVKIKQKISKLQLELKEIQDNCAHENVKGVYKANTGNWCQYDDSYWIDATCLDCDKRLHIDSEKERDLYRKYSMSGQIKNS
ncbi:hypothetical protein D3C80_1988690 [compost metagenome]